ncbi:MAG: SAM-dependent methyltransferase [Thiohalocapsa sp.]
MMSHEQAEPEDLQAHAERLSDLIRRAVTDAGGALPFDRFMDLALYAPGLGYYVAGAAKLGADGDFVTAPEISPLFGRCVAEQCREVLGALGGGDLLEFGAGSGALAAEVLSTLAAHDALPERYLILELSPDLAARQRALLQRRVPALCGLVQWIDALPEALRGVVLANEVLDAMPVQRFCIGEAGAVREVFVEIDGDGFAARRRSPLSPGLIGAVELIQGQIGVTTGVQGGPWQPGYCSEINLRLGPWVRAVADSLSAGLALLIDYGYPRAEYYLPERTGGTLMCHHRHQAHADPFVRIGLQDITAHVDFTALAEAGAECGLALAGYTTQANFLLGCGLDHLMAEAADDPAARLDLAAGVKQLLLPSAMGERFQVMALSKQVQPPEPEGWRGFSLRDLSGRL